MGILDGIHDTHRDVSLPAYLRKACHLPAELDHRAYWAIKKLNLSLDEAGKQRLLQLLELQELRHDAYENTVIYKDNTKAFHDRHIRPRSFQVNDKV